MQPVALLTLFTNRYAKEKFERSLPLDAVPALLRSATAPRKEALPLLKLGLFGELRSSNGALRNNENLRAITGIEGDYDGESMPFAEAVERLVAADVTAILYTSPSHIPEKPRWRVLCPTSIELPPAERDRLMARLNGIFGGVLGPESWTLSQCYFYGSVAPLRRPGRTGSDSGQAAPNGAGNVIEIRVLHGSRYIDEAGELDAGAIGKNGRAADDADSEPHIGAEPEAPLASVEAALALIPNDDRPWENGSDGWNEVGMAVFRATGGSEPGFAAFDEWSQKSAKYDAERTRERWEHYWSSPPGRIGFGKLVYLARLIEPDWVPPHHHDPDPVIWRPWPVPPLPGESEKTGTGGIGDGIGDGPGADIGGAGGGATATPAGSGPGQRQRRLEFIHARDVRPQLESAALVKGLLDHEQLSLMVGKPGCGKSFLTIDRDLSIAAAVPWFDHKVAPGPVVYLALEAGSRIIQNRTYAWLKKHGISGCDVPFAAITTPVDLCHMRAGDVPLLVETIRSEIGFERLALLEIDTVSRAMAGGDENAPDDMGAFVFALDLLRAALHCHVAAVHHPGKDEHRGARGWSGLPAAIDTWQEVARLGDTGISSYRVTRQRDGIAGEQRFFRLPQVQLGIDEDADPVTTCIVDPVATPGEADLTAARMTAVKLLDADRIARTQLDNAIAEAGEAPPAGSGIPTGKKCVRLELWRAYAYRGGISSSDKLDSRRKAFNRAATKLIAAGLVCRNDEWVWLP